MPLTLTLRFPTGRYVAASTSNRDELEWPPHPARLLLGLLATHYRRGGPSAERAALQWLCEQPPPELFLPPDHLCTPETMSGVFVPQNPSEAKSLSHPRKARSFPSMLLPEDQPLIAFHWPQAEPDAVVRESLRLLVADLARLGHSSSLVAAEITDTLPAGEMDHLQPLAEDSPSSPDHRLRVGWPGLLDSAEQAYAAAERENELLAAFQRRDQAAERSRPLTKFEASPRGRYDPRHITAGYLRQTPKDARKGPWENSLFVLRRTGGDRIGLPSIWQIATVLHKAMLDHWTRAHPHTRPPSWISGHQPGEGHTAPSSANHLAILPLAHVDHIHADGRLLGLGLAFPTADEIGLTRQELRQQWRAMLIALLDEGRLTLTPKDQAWSLELEPDDGSSGRSLLPSTWCRPARTWKSVTPIILDRHPKPHFKKDPAAWAASCQAILSEACHRIGLPIPESIHVSPYSPVPGVPPASAFVAPERRPNRPARFHIHAVLHFPEQVSGPLMLGAGRFRGYGLLKPAPYSLP